MFLKHHLACSSSSHAPPLFLTVSLSQACQHGTIWDPCKRPSQWLLRKRSVTSQKLNIFISTDRDADMFFFFKLTDFPPSVLAVVLNVEPLTVVGAALQQQATFFQVTKFPHADEIVVHSRNFPLSWLPSGACRHKDTQLEIEAASKRVESTIY